MKTLKIPFKEFVEIGIEELAKKYPEINVEKYTFMRAYGHEPDSEAYELPDYLEMEIKEVEII